MAQTHHKDLLRQLGLVEDSVKRTQTAAFGLKSAHMAGVGEGYVTGQRERLKKECTLLIGLMTQFADSLHGVIGDCDTMLKLFMTLSKSAQKQGMTEQNSSQLATSLDNAKMYADKLLHKVNTYIQAFLRCVAKPYPDASEVEELIHALIVDIELVSFTKLVVENMGKAIALQNALAPKFKDTKERGSWFGRLFGLKPSYG